MRQLRNAALAQVCALVTDGTHDTPRRIEDGFPLIKAKEIVGGIIDFDSCDQISETEHLQVIARSKPEYGDTLFAHIGASLGEAALVKTRRPFSIKNIALFKPNPAVIDGRYLYYLVISPEFQGLAKNTRTGSAQPFLSLGHLRSHQVRYHESLDEQRKIAAILSAYDDLIENNLLRIKILEEMAQSLYREWFVKFRFPGHQHARFVDSPLGPIPEGWRVVKVKEIATVNERSIRKARAPNDIAYVDISSVTPGQIEKIEELRFCDAPSRARRIVHHGDIIWSSVRPNRRSFSLIIDPPPNLVVSTGFAVVSATAIPFTYLYHATTTDDFVVYLVNHAKGAAYPAVNAQDFENANILRPPKELLIRFDEWVLPKIVLAHRLRAKNIVLRRTRDLLLPKLISGELDVSELDIATGKEAA